MVLIERIVSGACCLRARGKRPGAFHNGVAVVLQLIDQADLQRLVSLNQARCENQINNFGFADQIDHT